MPRITKAMLENQIIGFQIANTQLRQENEKLKEINKLLTVGRFSINEFFEMHREVVIAITHTVTDLRQIIQDRRL